MSDELKPCPFCGGAPAEIIFPEECNGNHLVRCTACGLAVDGAHSVAEAVRRWNTRPIEDELRADATLWRDHVGQRQAMHYTWAIMEDEAKTFFGDVADLRAKWDAIPWGPIIACAGIASFQRGAPEAMTVLEWYKDNAPKEATK
jgi:Lar family restriction alleviation protein